MSVISFKRNTALHANCKGLYNQRSSLSSSAQHPCFTLVCVCSCLTQNSDGNAGRVRLAIDTLSNTTYVGSTVGLHSMRKDQAGAHGCGRDDICLRLILNELKDKSTFLV